MQVISKRKIALLLGLSIFINANAATCTVSNDGLNFGNYNPLALTDTTTTVNVQVSCSGLVSNVSYDIKLSSGSSGNINTRKLLNGANEIVYNIYTESSYTSIWGDGITGNAVVGTATAPAETKSHTGYAIIPHSQAITPGLYSDNITITLTY